MSTQNSKNLITVPSNENSDFQPIRPYESLSQEEQQRVQELLAKLDDYSNQALSDFSAEAASNSAREAEDFLKHTKLNDLQDFNESMRSLTKDLRSINPKDLSKQEPSSLARIPLIGKRIANSHVGKKVEGIIQKQETVAKAIGFTVDTITGIKLTLQEDLIKCQKTRATTVQYAKDLELQSHALYQKRMELERTYNEFINSPEYDPKNIDHSEYAAKLQNGIQRIERKIRDTIGYQSNALSDIPSYSLIANSEEALIDAIDDCIKNVIPEWKKSFQKAIIAYRVANAADAVASSKKATNDIILASAHITSAAIISAAEAIETPQIASETLEEKTQIFLQTVSTLIDIGVKASQERVEEIRAIKSNDKSFLAENAKRTTVSSITATSGGNSYENK